MIELFSLLGILLVIYFVFKIIFKNNSEQTAPSTPPGNLIPINVIAKSVNDIVGTYMDLSICRYVQVDDSRIFVFESIAVERSPGVYQADDTKAVYIIVDKCLLYREFNLDLINN